jgi:hypothetical protein
MYPFFTYQGQLKLNGGPYTGSCDFIFYLFNAQTGITPIGSGDYENAVPISNGLFTVTLNASEQFNPANDSVFQGDLRYLNIWVRCPTSAGGYTELLPRQIITAVPYALTLVPGSQGSRVNGSAYQLLKVTNATTATGVPAAVTGEINTSVDGVGVYGGNTVSTAGATGMGVWGRSLSPNGAGVKGTGLGSGTSAAVGVIAENNGTGIYHPALYANNTDTGTTTPAGIAIYGLNASADATLVLRNTYHNASTVGLLIAGINYNNSARVYSVDGNGHVISTLMTTTAGSDLAEQFPVSGAPEPGTLMVIDPDHPGQLKVSTIAYDTKVAGVVSGAGGLQAGMTLAEVDGLPIALAGRVYVKADASSAPIQPGDLLTSSSLPGFAMKATDRGLAAGAVIGKAMSGLDSGTGLVLVLVSLQ